MLARQRAAGDMSVELACSQYITPLNKTAVPFLPGKVSVPTPVIKLEQPSVATLSGMGEDKDLKLERTNLSPVRWFVAPVSDMILGLADRASAVISPASCSSAILSSIFPTLTCLAVIS